MRHIIIINVKKFPRKIINHLEFVLVRTRHLLWVVGLEAGVAVAVVSPWIWSPNRGSCF